VVRCCARYSYHLYEHYLYDERVDLYSGDDAQMSPWMLLDGTEAPRPWPATSTRAR
jgi:hypothetical protein